MADKGFHLKVLVPTDDGLTISENGVENSLYYLMYNISNRSYQLAGKIKTNLLFTGISFSQSVFVNYCSENFVDAVVVFKKTEGIHLQCIKTNQQEIGESLNRIIDQINEGLL